MKLPNILVTGTPGTGKTTLCQTLGERTSLQHLNVSEIVKDKGLHEGRNDEFDTLMLDEDKVVDELEDAMTAGGKIVDFHSCEFFPERWFDLVIVLTTDNTTIFDRLTRRGYSEKKISENVECEIMQIVLQEAQDSYAQEIVHELKSVSVEDMEANAERIIQWIQQWQNDHANDE